jgi:signal peptidase II
MENKREGTKGDAFMIWILIAIICGSVALDQLTKWIAVLHLQPVDSIPLWEGVLHLTYVENPGAAWGMLADHRWVFMVFSTIAIIGLGIYLFGFSKEPTWVKVSLALVVGGGIGNMIDRVILGYVVDFIYVALINFPVFNVADSCVTVGAGMLMFYFVKDFIKEVRASKKSGADGRGSHDDL